MSKKYRFITVALVAVAATMLLLALTTGALAAPKVLVVGDGLTQTIESTVSLNKLVLGNGAQIVAPTGKALTLTVNGVETGGVLESTPGVNTIIVGPAKYLGNVVLTVTEANIVSYMAMGPPGQPPVAFPFPFRQALYLDGTGIVDSKSVVAAVVGKKPSAFSIPNIQIRSTGQNFDGIFVAGGHYSVTNAKISLQGNGRSDFIGYGAAIVARGDDTRLVIDGTRIVNTGVVRTGVVADAGANVIVKNSYIQTNNGVLPSDYVPTIDTTQMRSVPWMLSLSGNVRATNLLGTHTKASYINSYIGSQGWGVLSTDGCFEPTLTVVNSTIAITGKDGYGSYGIGNATENFLGCTFNVATYATISRGSFLHYGDSDRAAVAAANTSLGLGLTAKELARIPVKPTIVNSQRFGVMWHGGGTLGIDGGTVFNTKESTFLDKGQAIQITVDGSEGAKLNPGNGVIMQVMDDDDPGPVPPEMTNTGVYHEPTGPVVAQPGHDLTTAAGNDAVATFIDTNIVGDFFNGMRGDIPGPFGPPAPRNLGLTFNESTVVGLITASTTHHLKSTITAADYRYLGEVTNTASQSVNNGVNLTLNDSRWTVTGTCHLTKLVLGAGGSVVAPAGHTLTVMVDPDFGGPAAAVPVTLAAGNTYTGYITVTVN